jgi:metal-sulfur cluster biosynthetic enzyme
VKEGVAMLNEDAVRVALRKVKDPELDLSIIDLGLVYEIAVHEGEVHIQMSLTSPGCPSGPEIMLGAQEAIEALDGVTKADVELVWSPYWTPDRIDPKVRAYLGL